VLPAETAAAPARAGKRKSFRRAARWAALSKNVLSSAKDLGIIGLFFALAFFREPMLGSFREHAPELLRPTAIELEGGLDALEARGENALLSSQEESVLNIPASAAIRDWSVVLTSDSDLREAQARRTSLAMPQSPGIFRKGDRFHLVVQSGNRSAVRAAMQQLREVNAGAYLISLAHWCGNMDAADGYIQCAPD
jgi:hypothetical protein